MRQRIAVYGSLRNGQYNYERFLQMFGKQNFKLLKEGIEVSGFDLYNLGPYPAVTFGSNNLVIDVLSVSDNVYRAIRGMELGAGYTESTVKVPRYGEIFIYTFPEGSFPKERLIADGDWSNFKKI